MSCSFFHRTLALVVLSTAVLAGSARAQNASDSPWQNFQLFAGLDGLKQPQDLGINANMGVRVSANLGVPIAKTHGLGAQIGVALNASDAAVHVLDQIEGTSRRTQTFVTAGVFQRAGRANWGLAYDLLVEQYYDDFTLGQARGVVGYDVTATGEIGAWFTKSVAADRGSMGGTAVRLAPISQVNGYYTHTWPTRARTSLWAGVANGHHNIVWVLPDNSRDDTVFVYGAELDLPLSDRVAISGAANFLTPTATGTVDAFLGLTFFTGKRVPTRGGFGPRQTVANNPSFPVNMNR